MAVPTSIIRQTIAAKLEAEAPGLHGQLAKAGTLEAFLDETAEEITATAAHEAVKVGNAPALRDRGLERIRAMEDAQHRSVEVSLAELAFPVAVLKTTDSVPAI